MSEFKDFVMDKDCQWPGTDAFTARRIGDDSENRSWKGLTPEAMSKVIGGLLAVQERHPNPLGATIQIYRAQDKILIDLQTSEFVNEAVGIDAMQHYHFAAWMAEVFRRYELEEGVVSREMRFHQYGFFWCTDKEDNHACDECY